MEFHVEIELGNEAMESPQDVAKALRDIAIRLDPADTFPSELHEAGVRDANGNTVGGFFAKN